MNVANLYKKIKQVLDDANISLTNMGLENINSISELCGQINDLEINRLPYMVKKEIVEITEDDISEITEIYHRMFYQCVNLEHITIPNSVTIINEYAFYGCYNLASIIIPDSVTYISHWVFTGCTNLADIYLNSTTPPTLSDVSGIPTTTTIHVPIGSGEAYRSATNWSSLASRIVEDVIAG